MKSLAVFPKYKVVIILIMADYDRIVTEERVWCRDGVKLLLR